MHRLPRTIARGERGQTIVWAAFSAVMVLGFTALAIDGGLYMANIRDAQTDADAAALAGAQELLKTPPGDALAKCQEWAANNAAGAGITCSVGDFDSDGNPDVTAEVERSQSAAFARVLPGDPFEDGFPVDRMGIAEVIHAGGGRASPWSICGDPTLPDFGLIQEDGDGIVEEDEVYTVKVGALGGPDAGDSDCYASPETGNFQILEVGGIDDADKCKDGADGYRWAIQDGGSCEVMKTGDMVSVYTKPGNLGQNTDQALSQYLSTWEDPANWEYCDDYAAHGDEPTCLGRYVPIPIIENDLPEGKKEVQVYALAPAYITWWARTGPWKDAEVRVIILDNVWIPAWTLVGECDPDVDAGCEFAPLRIKLAG
jgi:hypothetical protein